MTGSKMGNHRPSIKRRMVASAQRVSLNSISSFDNKIKDDITLRDLLTEVSGSSVDMHKRNVKPIVTAGGQLFHKRKNSLTTILGRLLCKTI